MDKVWLQKSIMEDDDEDLMQETHRDNITNLLEECLIEVDLDWKDEEEVQKEQLQNKTKQENKVKVQN